LEDRSSSRTLWIMLILSSVIISIPFICVIKDIADSLRTIAYKLNAVINPPPGDEPETA